MPSRFLAVMQAGRMDSACPVCGTGAPEHRGRLAFYLRGGKADTDILRCGGCGSWWRSFPEPVDLERHFEVASYSNPKREEEWRRQRHSFFAHLVRLTLRTLRRPPEEVTVLDVGCAYGHLMEAFARRGCRCAGVEPVAAQRALIEARGAFTVYPDLTAVPEDRYDAILAVDSLYYMPGPPALHLKRMTRLLAPGGVLVLRIANRSAALDLHRRFGRPNLRPFGDALFIFSHRGMMHLLGQAGLRLEALHRYEHKRLRPRPGSGFLLNRVLPAVAAITRIHVSPGLTYVCRHAEADAGRPASTDGA